MTGKCCWGRGPGARMAQEGAQGCDNPPPPVRLSSLPPAFLAPMMETLKASTEQGGGGVQTACIPTPPPSLDSHGQIPGLMGEGCWAPSLPPRKWSSEPANQGWGMPGEGIARRPRGLVVRDRLWVQEWAFPLPSCVALGGSLNLSVPLLPYVLTEALFWWAVAGTEMVPSGCCSQLVLCSVRGADFSQEGIPGTHQRGNSICELIDTSARPLLGSPGDCRAWSSSEVEESRSLVLLSASSHSPTPAGPRGVQCHDCF